MAAAAGEFWNCIWVFCHAVAERFDYALQSVEQATIIPTAADRQRLTQRDPWRPLEAMKLTDLRAHDGSRQFLSLPESVSWERLRMHLSELPGVEITTYLTDEVTEVWIDFEYRGQQFSANNQCGEFWFFVRDPDCPSALLEIVAQHSASLLGSDEPTGAR